MKIAFYLPRVYYHPGGGAKIVLEYANYLASKGNEIFIYYHNPSISFRSNSDIKHTIKICADYCIGKLFGCSKWFDLNQNVEERIISNAFEIKPCDVVVATAIQLVESVLNLPSQYKKKVYLIQGYETWEFSEDRIISIYQKSKNNIVISKWLETIVDGNSNQKSYLIPNFIDDNVFFCSNRNRDPHSLTFHYRSASIKGGKYGIDVINRLYSLYPDIKVKIVTTEKKLPRLPACCELYTNIKPEEVALINNSCEVFMCTTIEEGFGLPGLEAMACGCALATTNYAAVYDYADDNYNALISPIKDVDAMVSNIVKLFEDSELRDRISRNAIITAKKRSKQETFKLVEKYFYDLAGEVRDEYKI